MAKATRTKKSAHTKRATRQSPSKSLPQKSWASTEVFLKLAIVFIFVQTLGLYVARQLTLMGFAQPPFTNDINDITNALFLFGSIIIMTVVILVLLKLKRTKHLLLYVEALALASTSILVFGVFFPTDDILVLLITLVLLAWRYTHRDDVRMRNVMSMIAIAGAGSYIGISFGLVPVLAFIIILAVYDLIAVFVTKHMVTIGKAATGNNYAFMIALPTKEHNFELGNGDLVIPLAVASSILANGPFHLNWLVMGLCLGASYVGLMISIYTVSVKKVAMPALPPQTLLMCIIIGAALLLGL